MVTRLTDHPLHQIIAKLYVNIESNEVFYYHFIVELEYETLANFYLFFTVLFYLSLCLPI